MYLIVNYVIHATGMGVLMAAVVLQGCRKKKKKQNNSFKASSTCTTISRNTHEINQNPSLLKANKLD